MREVSAVDDIGRGGLETWGGEEPVERGGVEFSFLSLGKTAVLQDHTRKLARRTLVH